MFLKLYLTALVIFMVIDMFWLGLIAKNFYQQQLGFLMKAKANLFAALIFYFIFIYALVVFVIAPGVAKESVTDVIMYGALFGLATYSAYDFSNLATLKNWPFMVTLVDMLWGTMVSSLVSLLTCLVALKFF